MTSRPVTETPISTQLEPKARLVWIEPEIEAPCEVFGAGHLPPPQHQQLAQPGTAPVRRREPIDRDRTSGELQRLPVEVKIIDPGPDPILVGKTHFRRFEPVGKAAGKPADRDQSAGQLRCEPCHNCPSRLRVGASQQRHNRYHDQSNQSGNAPTNPSQDAPHQNACPIPR